MTTFNRRSLLAAGASLLAGPLLPTVSRGASAGRIPIADMHYHLFFFGKRPASTQPLARNMADGGATLVSWSLVGDVPWLRPAAGGFKQKGTPGPGEPTTWLKEEMARVHGHLRQQGLTIARSPADVDRAAAGEPHVVLSAEGATFLDDGPEQLQVAYDLGLRHIQLVHFIVNRIGDMQTEPPRHDGLTDYGRDMIRACNKLGILVDLAHCTEAAVEQALAVSKAPMVWSHSSVAIPSAKPAPRVGWRARQLPHPLAKEIAARGGVVGLWALGADVSGGVAGYARRIADMAERLGEDHVAFGTDMNALSNPALRRFSDLRAVVETLEDDGMAPARLRKIAFDNYARVLKAAMQPTA